MKINYPLIFFPILLGACFVSLPENTVAQDKLPNPIAPTFIDVEPLEPIPGNRPLPNPNQNRQRVNTPTFANSYRYRVFIDGTNPSLLARVRTFIPDAFIRRGEGVIQGGAFREQDRFKAELRLQELAARGITARIVDSNTGQSIIHSGSQSDLNTNNSFGQPIPNFTNASSNNDRSFNSSANGSPYFVIIPGGLEQLPSIAEQVANFGINQELVRQRETPRGPHVLVGPFADRGLAQQWESYLRDAGLDARVHFER